MWTDFPAWFDRVYSMFWSWVGLHAFSKLFRYIDIYAPGDGDTIVGITFSQSEEYIHKVGDIE